ncbi:MAG: hypothetical protein U5R06_13540 [candidate division KSB1 bacterium]|nr:hypothetical protein [candidate division KSB1 bacterium]
MVHAIFTGAELISIGSPKNKRSSMAGIAPFPGTFWPWNDSVTFIEPNNATEYRVLAHELGHLLSHMFDSPTKPYIFFPKKGVHPDSTDASIETHRRISKTTHDTCLMSPLIK